MKCQVISVMLLSFTTFICFSGQKEMPRYLSLAMKKSGIYVMPMNRFPVYTQSAKLSVREARGMSFRDQKNIEELIFQNNLQQAKDVSQEHVRFIDLNLFLNFPSK